MKTTQQRRTLGLGIITLGIALCAGLSFSPQATTTQGATAFKCEVENCDPRPERQSFDALEFAGNNPKTLDGCDPVPKAA